MAILIGPRCPLSITKDPGHVHSAIPSEKSAYGQGCLHWRTARIRSPSLMRKGLFQEWKKSCNRLSVGAQSLLSSSMSMRRDDEASVGQADAELTFYTHTLCPYAHRVALTIIEKGVNAKTVHIDLSNKPGWFYKVNPRGLVPAVEHKGQIVCESLDICQFLDDTFPGPSLMPTKPEDRKEAERLILRCDSLASSGFQFLADPAGGSWSLPRGKGGNAEGWQARGWEQQLAWLETELSRRGGAFFMGSDMSLVDMVYYPFLQRFALAMLEFRDLDIRRPSTATEGKGEGLTAVGKWLAAIDCRESSKKTSPEPSALLAAYRKHRRMDYFDYVTASLENP